MLKTILVPLDGSRLAEQAIPYASRLARSTGARLVLAQATLTEPLPGQAELVARAAATRRAEIELDVLVNRLRQEGLAVEARVYCEDAATAILDAATQEAADLIVMSTHGRSGLGRWIYGSVADRVLRTALIPVLLVPAACSGEWTTARPLRILVPLDQSPLAEEALGPASELAQALGAELLLLQVLEYPLPAVADGATYLPPLDQDADLAAARQYLEDLAVALRADGQTVTTLAVAAAPSPVGQAVATIAAVAHDERVDAVVMATHGRGGLARLVMGSVATGVLQHATVPVLVVRPAAVQARDAQPAEKPRARTAAG
jgi:nucleotide-binding universal stress UspA family protein